MILYPLSVFLWEQVLATYGEPLKGSCLSALPSPTWVLLLGLLVHFCTSSGSISPGPVSDFIDVPLEGIEGFGNRAKVQDVNKEAGLEETYPATEGQLDFMSMGAAMAADSAYNSA